MSTHSSARSATKRLSAAERRESLLAAAHAIVQEDGLERLTMEAIAARCGVNKALPYRHFANRDDVVTALYEHTTQALDAEMAPALAQAQSFEQKVRALVSVWIGFIEAGQDLPVLMQARTQDGALERAREARIASIVEFVSDLLRDAYDLDDKTAQLASAILLAGTQGLIAVYQTRAMPVDELVDAFVTMSLGAVDALRTT